MCFLHHECQTFVLSRTRSSLAEVAGEPWARGLLCLSSQEVSCRHTDLLSLDPAVVGSAGLAGLQQPGAIHLLEEALLHLLPQEPPAKRARGRPDLSPTVGRWMELARYAWAPTPLGPRPIYLIQLLRLFGKNKFCFGYVRLYHKKASA